MGRNKWRGSTHPPLRRTQKRGLPLRLTSIGNDRVTRIRISPRESTSVPSGSRLVGGIAVHVVTTSVGIRGVPEQQASKHGLPLARGCDTLKFAAEVDRKEISHESWERSRSRITARPSQRITRRVSRRGASGGRSFQSQD